MRNKLIAGAMGIGVGVTLMIHPLMATVGPPNWLSSLMALLTPLKGV